MPQRGRKSQRVVFQPRTYRGFQRGANQVVDAIRPTLGPRPRVVAIERVLDERMPELLDDGGTIAKRIIALGDRDEDIGAMFVREFLGRLHEQAGDGTATAAVLFQAVYNAGLHYLAAGGNAMRLQSYLEQGLQLILDQLSALSIMVTGKRNLARVAETICYDARLAELFGEIFDIIGEFGRLEIRQGRSREHRREYVEGMYWERGLMSARMIDDHSRQRTELESPAILISDLEIDDPAHLFPIIVTARQNGVRDLLLVASRISDRALGVLMANQNPGEFRVVAVTTPGYGQEAQMWSLEDLALLTGGRALVKAAGDTFEQLSSQDLGRARRAWADLRNFGIVGGKGDARALRRHIATLRAAYAQSDNLVQADKLRERIGKLLGGSATLWIGATTELEMEATKALADRTAAAMRGAMMEGVVPGGGVAFLSCRPALQERLRQSTGDDERAAFQILLKAMEAPLRTIVANAGCDASEAMAQIRLAGAGYGFDVTKEQVVDVREAGIVDAAGVVKGAAFVAVSSAALALTVDVIVHHREPEREFQHEPARRKRL